MRIKGRVSEWMVREKVRLSASSSFGACIGPPVFIFRTNICELSSLFTFSFPPTAPPSVSLFQHDRHVTEKRAFDQIIDAIEIADFRTLRNQSAGAHLGYKGRNTHAAGTNARVSINTGADTRGLEFFSDLARLGRHLVLCQHEEALSPRQ
jgi:hypothetical protein